jgi:hypothetical protein
VLLSSTRGASDMAALSVGGSGKCEVVQGDSQLRGRYCVCLELRSRGTFGFT